MEDPESITTKKRRKIMIKIYYALGKIVGERREFDHEY